MIAEARGDSRKAAALPTSMAASSFWMGAFSYEYLQHREPKLITSKFKRLAKAVTDLAADVGEEERNVVPSLWDEQVLLLRRAAHQLTGS